jgi:hypothetical protein
LPGCFHEDREEFLRTAFAKIRTFLRTFHDEMLSLSGYTANSDEDQIDPASLRREPEALLVKPFTAWAVA